MTKSIKNEGNFIISLHTTGLLLATSGVALCWTLQRIQDSGTFTFASLSGSRSSVHYHSVYAIEVHPGIQACFDLESLQIYK